MTAPAANPCLFDASGFCHVPAVAPARIVSLVPSVTELLFALGLEEQLVGRTHYCVHPAERIAAIPSVGGTKKIKHTVVQALHPTHVIVNIDENTKPMAERLAEYVPHLIVTHPLAPRDNLALYHLLGGIFQREAAATLLCQRFEQTLGQIQGHSWPRRKVLYLIWRKPWMTVSRDTYISRTLAAVGWDTLPAMAEPRYPLIEITRDLLDEVDLVLFSTEPYRFESEHLVEFARQYPCSPAKLQLINGEMTSWYGSRAIEGLGYLYRLAANLG